MALEKYLLRPFLNLDNYIENGSLFKTVKTEIDSNGNQLLFKVTKEPAKCK